MDCLRFLNHYSGYRDGLLGDPGLEQEIRDHLRNCLRCMRYDAYVARGVTLLRNFSDVAPSSSFQRALSRRIASIGTIEDPPVPTHAGIMVGFMVATAVALLFWEAQEPRVPAMAAASLPTTRPLPAIVAHAGVPFVSFADLSVPPFSGAWHAPGAEAPPPSIWEAAGP